MDLKRKTSVILLCSALLLSSCTQNVADTSEITQTTDTIAADTHDVQTGENDSEVSPYVNAEFSVPGGFYKSAEKLTLTLSENAPDGAYITYTLDGNEPKKSSAKYEDEITVADGKTTVVRAQCFNKDGEPIGRIKTNTYIHYEKDVVSAPYTVSIVTDSKNLYGRNGIITNSENSGKKWERVCHVEIFSEDGTEAVSQDAGLRIFGGSSRTLAQKSFRLVARKTGYYDELLYNGSGSFDYPFFADRVTSDGQALARFDRLILRNGGNDAIINTGADGEKTSMIRDAAVNTFAVKYAPAVAAQASCFAVVFLNGEYYGILDMKEDIDEDYVSNLYGIEDKENVAVVKSELDISRTCKGDHDRNIPCGRYCGAWFYYEVDSGPANALDDFTAMCQKVLNASDDEYDETYEYLSSKLDIENFMQYTALNLYFCNTDWGHNNLKLWCYMGENKDSSYKDGKWRFAMRDCDFAMGRYDSLVLPEIYTLADTNTFDFTLGNYYSGKFEYASNYADPLYLKGLLAFCLKNDTFRGDFEEYCRRLCSDEAKAYLKDIVKKQKETLSPIIKAHIALWQDHTSGGYSMRTWSRQITAIEDWIDDRSGYFISHMETALSNFD